MNKEFFFSKNFARNVLALHYDVNFIRRKIIDMYKYTSNVPVLIYRVKQRKVFSCKAEMNFSVQN